LCIYLLQFFSKFIFAPWMRGGKSSALLKADLLIMSYFSCGWACNLLTRRMRNKVGGMLAAFAHFLVV
jgi:hypothetical protein